MPDRATALIITKIMGERQLIVCLMNLLERESAENCLQFDPVQPLNKQAASLALFHDSIFHAKSFSGKFCNKSLHEFLMESF